MTNKSKNDKNLNELKQSKKNSKYKNIKNGNSNKNQKDKKYNKGKQEEKLNNNLKTKKNNINKTKIKEEKKNIKNKEKTIKKEKSCIEFYPCKKKCKLKKEVVIIIFIILSLIFGIFIYFLSDTSNEEVDKPVEEEITISYRDYYHDQVKLLEDKTLYELVDGEFKEIGTIYKDLVLRMQEDEYLLDGYFKVLDSNFYIDYKDLVLDNSDIKKEKETYLNYIPYNESVKTLNETNFYFDDKLLFTISSGMTFPILIKEDNYYGVLYEEKLYYLKKEEVSVFENKNTSLKHTDAIATLVYHFTYDSSNKEEEKNCKNSNITICLSDKLFKEHLTYMKENNFYTATMNDLSLFIDGKVQLPLKTVVLTIDDGYFVSAAIKVLEEMDMHATLFLIGSAGSPLDYKSDNLEIHSHTYALHYPGACAGGQGSPLKCLNKETLLADLKKSREQLNGSTVFCYPFFEYNDYAISVLKEAGFEMAFIGGRYKIKVGSNKYKLPRYGIINTTYVEDIKKIIN